MDIRRGRSNKVTSRDVAEAAGVSVASVSRALNKGDKVAPERRRLIEETAVRLGYVPHGAARALASQRTFTIGAVIPTLENPNFAIAVGALQRRLEAAGFTLLLSSSDYDLQREAQQVRAVVSRGIDGILLVGNQHSPDVYDVLLGNEIPVVETWSIGAREGVGYVGFDNEAAARQVADHLLDLGHRELGVIAGLSLNNDRATARVSGVRNALEARGLSLPDARMIERPYKMAEGQLALNALMGSPRRVTAVICGNDLLAFGALLEAARLGIAVPEELSIVGFDDLEFASELRPSLTTVRVPADQIGYRSAEFLLGRIARQPVPTVTEVDVSLVVRHSSGPPRGAQPVLRRFL